MCLAANQILPVPCPAGLEYLPYQLEGIEFARGRNAVLFGDEPGLGKTSQPIAWIVFPNPGSEPNRTAFRPRANSMPSSW